MTNDTPPTKDEIRAWRESLRWTQEQVARTLGVTARTVARWEAGDATPPPFLRLAMNDTTTTANTGAIE